MDHFVGLCINVIVVSSLDTKLLGKSNARDKWNHLSRIFTQQFFAGKSQVRGLSHTTRGGNSSSFDFLQQNKSIDSLAQ